MRNDKNKKIWIKIFAFFLGVCVWSSLGTQVFARSILEPDCMLLLPTRSKLPVILNKEARNVWDLIFQDLLQQYKIGTGDPGGFLTKFDQLPLIPVEESEYTDWLEVRELKWPKDILAHFFRSGMWDVRFVLRETETEHLYQVGLLYSTWNGKQEVSYDFMGGIDYLNNSGLFRGGDGRGLYRLGFDYDAAQHMFVSSPEHWLSTFGYNQVYDWIAPGFKILLSTERFEFSYETNKYLIQFWKGKYFVGFHGGEIGIYARPEERVLAHYDGNQIKLPMSISFHYREQLLFETGMQTRWWLPAIQYGSPANTIFPAEQLRMHGQILFPDEAMLSSFLAAFAQQRGNKIFGHTDGLLFSFDW